MLAKESSTMYSAPVLQQFFRILRTCFCGVVGVENDLRKGEEEPLEYLSKLGYKLITDIEINPNNPREQRGKFEVDDLKESIARVGVLVPLVVYPKPNSPGKFILLEGERRLHACEQLYEETKDKRFLKVPVNILRAPPDPLGNYITMFNMHSNRRRWNKAAEAEALGKMRELAGERASNAAKLSSLTSLSNIAVEEELTYLDFSPDLRKLVTDGEIGQYNLILLGRNLKSLQDAMPEIAQKYSWHNVTHTLVRKVESGTIPKARDFNLLTSWAKTCIQNESEQVFVRAFDRLMKDPEFSIGDLVMSVQQELTYKIPRFFRISSENYRTTLTLYAKHHGYKVEKVIYTILTEIGNVIGKLKTEKG